MAFLNEQGLTTLWNKIDDKFARSSEVEEMVDKKPGRIVEGETFTYTIDDVETTAVAETGAEIFNDLNINVAVGLHAHAEGFGTKATGNYSHTEGRGTAATGYESHAEGTSTKATGDHSHAEGHYTAASGDSSHAEGSYNGAYGDCSHVEGHDNFAWGDSSHAEGNNTIANGVASHTEGKGTTDEGYCSHVQGKYNISDIEERYAHIVGNGDHFTHSNAHTLDWNGNTWYAGNLYLGGSSMDDATIKGFIVHNSTTSLPTVVNGAILIAYDA